MPPEINADLTTMLKQWRDGSGTAFADLIDRVYDELKVMANRRLSQSGNSATVSPTELLHEALIGVMPSTMDFKDVRISLRRCRWRSGQSSSIMRERGRPINVAAIWCG
jgi:hypothetical protein